MKSRRFRMRFVVCLVTVILLVGLAGACAEPAPEPAPPTPAQPTSAPPTPAAPEAIELIFSSNTPASAPMSMTEVAAMDLITERTGGKVTFVTYWANALMPDRESWTGLLAGTADLLHFAFGEDYQPINRDIMALPFMGYPSMEGGSEIWWKLYDKFPELHKEFEGAELISIRDMPPVQLHMITKVVKAPGDLKGMKIISSGDEAKVVNMVGGAPLDIIPGDYYMSLESGLADGIFNHFPVVSVFGCLPLFKHHTMFGDGGMLMTPMGVAMNANSWNKLPSDIQKIVKDSFHEEFYVKGIFDVEYAEINKYMNEATETGHTMTYLTPDEIKEWMDAAMPLHEEWIQEAEAKGYPGRAMYEEAKRLIAEYTK